jgi:hypothetical protein
MASVIVAGATGAIGRTVVQHAIRQPGIARVVALTRAANVTESNYAQLFGVATHREATESKKEAHATNATEAVMVTPLEAAKIKPVTIDWEAFTRYWATANVAATAATSESSDKLFRKYKEIFSGHTYAAMCLGTTRKDAGSAENFRRCDHDYVIAFTEAVLAFSAPASLDPQATFLRHINDGGKLEKAAAPNATDAGATATAPGDLAAVTTKSTATLRAICQISAGGADSDSWFLYMRTKGEADEATVERVHHHNKVAAAAAGAHDVSPVLLFLLRPGLLQRHGKSRWNEKLAKVVLPSIPVETCGAAVVSVFTVPAISEAICQRATPAAATAAKGKEGAGCHEKGSGATTTTSFGTPFEATKRMKKAGVPSAGAFPYVCELNNPAIKHLATYLPEQKLADEAP